MTSNLMIAGFTLYELLWYFYIYSVVGWVIETIYESVKQGLLVNRGFLMGCYCPIYGFGIWLLLFALGPFRGQPLMVFLLGMLLTTLLEYFVGWLMEVAFGAKWWDYSESKFNLKGRISLFTSLAWGVLCVVFLEFIHPAIAATIRSFDIRNGWIALYIVYGIGLADAVICMIAAIRLSSKVQSLIKLRERALAFIVAHAPMEEAESIRQAFFSSRVGELLTSGYDRIAQLAHSTTQSLTSLKQGLVPLREKYDSVIMRFSLNERRFFRAFPSLYFPNQRELSEEVREQASQRKF